MLDDHPPFQIDGNFGGTAAITEALLQCTSGEIILLPALPDEWDKGSVRGLRAKGGFEINMEWLGGKLSKAEILSTLGGVCRIRLNCVASIVCDGETVCSRIEDGAIVFDTTENTLYTVNC